LVLSVWASPVSVNGALSFNNEGKIVNEHGNVVQLRGMSLFWDQWASGWFNENVVKTLANDWGASLIRAPLSQLSTSMAKSMIDWANSAGIYVIIDNHSHCAHRAASQAQSFFSEVSAYVKQKNYKHVIYEIYNEPLYENCNGATDTQSGGNLTSWSTIKSYAEGVIQKIRANDGNGLILVGTGRYSQDIGSAQKNPITSSKNIGYVLHFYASESGHSGLKTSLLRARCQNFPVFITEWGTSHADGNGSLDWSAINEWMAWIETLGYSWANWSLYDKNETSSAISSGGSSGNWQEYQLTESGKYVRKMMKGFGAGQSLSAMGLSQPTVQSCSIFEGGETYEFVRTGEGEFGKAMNAENYSDSSNIKSVEDASVHAYQDIYIVTTGDNAWTTYRMLDVPADGYYRMAFVYRAPNKDLEITYTVDGIAGETKLVLPKTTRTDKFTVNFSAIGLMAGESDIKFNLGGISASDLLFDAFWAAPMDSADSVDFGFMEVDEAGNRTIHDKPIEKSVGLVGVRPSKTELQLNVHGRIMEIAGATKGVSMGVLDMQGRVLMRETLTGSRSVDLSRLRPGTYVVQLKGAGVSTAQRIQLR